MDSQGTLEKTRVLVVDDDEVCLQIVSEMLKSWSFEVETVTHPVEALSMLRVNQFDIILSDYHMPDMNGMELQKRVNEEFKLPLIIISSDDRHRRIQSSLEGGAVHYITKPLKPGDLRIIAQCAVTSDKKMAIIFEESNSVGETSLTSSSSSSHSRKDESKRECSQKRVRRILQIHQRHPPTSSRKAKIVWTNALHDRFLEAVNVLGLDRAVPKRILEVMNVPGLSRENIASHLQKYRLFLKHVAENGSLKLRSSDKGSNPKFAHNILPASSSPIIEYPKPFQLGFGKVPSFFHGGNPNFLQFTQGAQGSSSTMPELRFEKSRSQPPLGMTMNPSFGGNNFHLGQSSSGLSSSIEISPSTLGLNFPWQSQGNTMSGNPKDNFAPFGFNSNISGFSNGLVLNANEGTSTMGINNVIRPELLSSNPPVNNFVGIRLTNNGELVGGGGQSQFINFGINISGVELNNCDEFGTANSQPMLPSGYETDLPPLPSSLEQQVGTNQGEIDNFKFDTMNGPTFPDDIVTYYQQPLGDGDYSNVFTQQANPPYMNGQDFLQYSDISNGSYIADYENNSSSNELLASEFSNLCQVQDNNSPDGPFSLQQYNGSGQQMETNTGITSLIPNDGFLSSTHSSEQQQQNKGEKFLDAILPPLNQNSVEQMVSQENIMDWEQEEYMQSLLGTVREFLGD